LEAQEDHLPALAQAPLAPVAHNCLGKKVEHNPGLAVDRLTAIGEGKVELQAAEAEPPGVQ